MVFQEKRFPPDASIEVKAKQYIDVENDNEGEKQNCDSRQESIQIRFCFKPKRLWVLQVFVEIPRGIPPEEEEKKSEAEKEYTQEPAES